jgi:hypothetical protein
LEQQLLANSVKMTIIIKEDISKELAKDLPSPNSEHVVLVQATPEERSHQVACNGVFWRGVLSHEAYIGRENHLAAQDLVKNDGMTTWVLVDQQNPAKRRVLCGCETFRKKALVAHNGVIRETVCHGVGSVFCPVEHRGKGYAARMIKDLGEILRTWQTDTSLFSILFSDIGKKFYAQHGWKAFPSSHIALPALEVQNKKSSLPKARPLYSADLAELCALDEKLLRSSLQETMKQSSKVMVGLIPDVETIKWHHAREEFVGFEFTKRMPEVKGAMVGEEIGKRVWCYWTRMFYNSDPKSRHDNTLHILRLVVESEGTIDWEVNPPSAEQMKILEPSIAALFAAAQEEADKWNMQDVWLWNPNSVTVKAAQSLDTSTEVIHRDDESICSLRWYGDEKELNNVVWVENEKYGWC